MGAAGRHRPAQVVHVTTAVNGVEVPTGGTWGPVIARWLLLGVLVLVPAEVVLAWLFGHYSGGAHRTCAGYATSRLTSHPALASRPAWSSSACVGSSLLVLLHDAVTGDFLGFLPGMGCAGLSSQSCDVPPPAPGEGSRWQLDYSSYLWDNGDRCLARAGAGRAVAVFVFALLLREGLFNAVQPACCAMC